MGLAEDAKAARDAGMTYGQYMLTKKTAPWTFQKGPRCLHCGKPIPPRRRDYCSDACVRERRLIRRRAGELI